MDTFYLLGFPELAFEAGFPEFHTNPRSPKIFLKTQIFTKILYNS